MRRAFSLVELLVVITLLAVIVSLTASTVHKVREVGNRTKTKAIVIQLGLSALSFQGAYESLPQLTGGGPNGEFRLCTSYLDPNTGRAVNWPEVDFLLAVWPSMSLKDNGLRVNGAAVPQSSPLLYAGNRALVFWLTGGEPCEYRGLSKSPATPFAPPQSGVEKRSKFLDVEPSMISGGELLDGWRQPLVVFSYDKKYGGYRPIPQKGVLPYRSPVGYYNANGIQAISSGPDKQFGPGGDYTPGNGPWAPNAPGGDDVANFGGPQMAADGSGN